MRKSGERGPGQLTGRRTPSCLRNADTVERATNDEGWAEKKGRGRKAKHEDGGMPFGTGRPGKGKSEKRKGDRLTRSRMGRDGVVRKESRQKRVVASSGVQWNFIILRGLAVAFRESPMCPWTNRTRIGPRAREAFRPPNAPCGAVGAGSLACRKSVELLKAKLQLPGACQAWNKPLCAWSHAGNRRRGLGD